MLVIWCFRCGASGDGQPVNIPARLLDKLKRTKNSTLNLLLDLRLSRLSAVKISFFGRKNSEEHSSKKNLDYTI